MTLRRNTYYAYLLCFPIVESCRELSRYNYEVSREKMQFVKSKIFLTLVFILQSVSTVDQRITEILYLQWSSLYVGCVDVSVHFCVSMFIVCLTSRFLSFDLGLYRTVVMHRILCM